jgi:hypothetical protein
VVFRATRPPRTESGDEHTEQEEKWES